VHCASTHQPVAGLWAIAKVLQNVPHAHNRISLKNQLLNWVEKFTQLAPNAQSNANRFIIVRPSALAPMIRARIGGPEAAAARKPLIDCGPGGGLIPRKKGINALYELTQRELDSPILWRAILQELFFTFQTGTGAMLSHPHRSSCAFYVPPTRCDAAPGH
jgi:hypothetical protein